MFIKAPREATGPEWGPRGTFFFPPGTGDRFRGGLGAGPFSQIMLPKRPRFKISLKKWAQPDGGF